jgi:uridine kinase
MSVLFVGIAGGTGSGKTTIARKIAAGLPKESVSIIEHDSYYRDLAGLSEIQRAAVNFDHPAALETPLLIEHLVQLRTGKSIEVPIYDFKHHRRADESREVTATPIVIIEGILVFVEPALRDLFDMKLFVDTDSDIRIFRRIRRDVEQRGRTFESIRDQYYRTVRPMHLEFVEPSKRIADLIIPEGGNNQVALDLITCKLQVVAEQARLAALATAPVTPES